MRRPRKALPRIFPVPRARWLYMLYSWPLRLVNDSPQFLLVRKGLGFSEVDTSRARAAVASSRGVAPWAGAEFRSPTSRCTSTFRPSGGIAGLRAL